MAYYVQSLSVEHRKALLRQLKKGVANKNEVIFTNLLNLKVDTVTSHSEYFLTTNDHGKEFYRFKKRLEEFRLTISSIDFLDKTDVHAREQLQITRKLTATLVQMEQGLMLNALDNFLNLYKKACSIESIILQKEITSRIIRIYQTLRLEYELEAWKDVMDKINENERVFRNVAEQFNRLTSFNICCKEHMLSSNMSDWLKYQGAHKKSGMVKIDWMLNYIRALAFRSENKHEKSQIIAWKLLESFLKNKKVFSRQYYLILMQFILENMYFLNKGYVVKKASRYVDRLDRFPVYQSFPLISLNLYELFRQGNGFKMLLEIEKLESRVDVLNFYHIRQHLATAKVHALMLQKEYQKCLIMINRDVHLQSLTCCRQQSDIKVLEFICLFETKRINLLFERLEAMRKYLSRKKNEDLIKYNLLYSLFKEVSFYGLTPKYRSLINKINNISDEIYSFQVIGIKHWLRNRNYF